MTKTEYARVTFVRTVRVFSGVMPRAVLDGKNGVRLFRVTDGLRDDLVIEVEDERDPWDVPWAQVASAQRVPDQKETPARREPKTLAKPKNATRTSNSEE